MIRVTGVLFAVMGTCSLFAADFSTYRGEFSSLGL